MITKRFVSDFNSIIRAKLYFFLRRSMIRYLIVSMMLGFVQPISTIGRLGSSFIYFLGIMVVLFPLQIISAKIITKKINFDADITFNFDDIVIKHRNVDKTETKDWSWISMIDSRKDRINLILNEKIRWSISIPKSQLSKQEIEFFERKKIA